jgi:hypothetical protein
MLPKVEDLSCACVDVKPTSVDWSEGHGERWTFLECSHCDKCGAIVDSTMGEEKHCQIDLKSTCDGYVSPGEGPMMNYFYSVDGYAADAEDAAKLVDLPVCIVTDPDGSDGLAFTGGGMDLSWEICEAYMILGYLPPVHFADLPAYSSKKLDERAKWVIAGCMRSCEIAARWATDRAKTLRALRASMAAKSAKRSA